MNSNSPLVSICVPIYNVEEYIERCLISLFEQTYDNLEYIFINDCSQDHSIDILNKVSKRYSNRIGQIRIIENKSNLGLASTRNKSILYANGEFLTIVDSDDYIDKRMIELFMDAEQSTNADIITCQNYHLFNSFTKIFDNYTSASPKETSMLIFQRKFAGSIWGRLYRTDLFKNNNIKCEDGINMGEDLQQVCKLFYYSKKVVYISQPLYYYDFTRKSSYSNHYTKEKLYQDWKSHDIVKGFFLRQDPLLKEETDKAELKLICTHLVYSARFKNISYYYDEAKRRLSFIDKKVWKSQPFQMRAILLLSNYKWLMNPYIKISRGLKWLFIKLRNR